MNRRCLPRSSIAITLLTAIVLVLALSGSSAATTTAASRLTTRHTAVGQILVDGHGRSLYLFEADKLNRSTLSRAGLKVWPAFSAARLPSAGGGVSAAHISLIETQGHKQVAYFGHPLYYFVGDQTPGETTGQGLREFGALWFAVSASGKADTAHAASAAPAAASTAPAAATPAAAAFGY